MPLWNRFPNLTRVNRLERHLSTFLAHWEMKIPHVAQKQIRQGMIDLADGTPVRGFINTSFVAGKEETQCRKNWLSATSSFTSTR
jgi:hypothetical protein